MKLLQPLPWLALLLAAGFAHADDWGSFATVSNTSPGTLCDVTDDNRDLNCVAPNPQVLDGGVISATGVSVTGVVSASAFVGDGSGLTGIGGTINELDDIGDVDAPSPPVDAALVWNGSNWVAGAALTGCMAGDTSIVPAMSSNSDGGYVASGSSQYSGTYTYFQAFDDTATGTDGWLTANGQLTGHLQIQMPLALEVISYAITARSNSPGGTPNTWTLEGSNNGSDWDVVDSRSGETGWTSSERREYAVSSPGAYSYYRIDVTANDGYGSYVSITELDLYKMVCSGADDLGSHTASQTLVMAGNDITGAGEVSASSVKVGGQDSCTTAADLGRIRRDPATGKLQVCR